MTGRFFWGRPSAARLRAHLGAKYVTPRSDARAITLSEGTAADVALCGPDGLVSVPGSDDEIVVVENGGCTAATPRVVSVTLALD